MTETVSELPPGQVYGKRWIIYAALGAPDVDVEKWRLRVDGLVERPFELTYQELVNDKVKKYSKPFSCLLPGSIVYANPEPIEIQKLRGGAVIVGGDGNRHIVKRIIRKQHSGPVIGVKASYLPHVMMTPDHPVLVVKGHPGAGKWKSRRRMKTFRKPFHPGWVRADELKLGDYAFFPKYRYTSRRKSVRVGNRTLDIDGKLATVIGWYVAEGSQNDSEGRTIAFSLSVNDEPYIPELRQCLTDVFGAKTSVYHNERETLSSVVVTSSDFRRLAELFKSWCGEDALTKRIPEFILNADVGIVKRFLINVFRGDGFSPAYGPQADRHSDFIDITTSSRILAYQLILAFSKLHIPAGMVNHAGSVRDGFSIRVRGKKLQALFPGFPDYKKIDKFHYWETARGFFYPIRKIWREEYRGTVYDFQASGYTMLSPFVTQDCVTKWTIEHVDWEGVPISELAMRAGASPEAKWVMFHCVDGYTAPVPVEDALNENAIVAFKINGRPLSRDQGFPARPFMPELYGWKSAKWLNRIEFMRDYKDGYWEMYGYHERGNIWDEERFKGHTGKHSKRTAIGTAW